MTSQNDIDRRNTEFWSELCGSGLARQLGITETTPESLLKFDKAYMDMYPYLAGYVTREALQGKKILEIGLGYGTLGEFIAKQGGEYFGLDIAPTPVMMMRYRLNQLEMDGDSHVMEGSALEIPFKEEMFDYLYSIGCLHHTGNLAGAIDEVYRVLKPGGQAIIMLYNKDSFRQFSMRLRRRFSARLRQDYARSLRASYDTNASGEAAPHTDYVSRKDVMHLFRKFGAIRIDCQNFDNMAIPLNAGPFGQRSIPVNREKLLGNVARLVGLDYYIVAKKG